MRLFQSKMSVLSLLALGLAGCGNLWERLEALWKHEWKSEQKFEESEILGVWKRDYLKPLSPTATDEVPETLLEVTPEHCIKSQNGTRVKHKIMCKMLTSPGRWRFDLLTEGEKNLNINCEFWLEGEKLHQSFLEQKDWDNWIEPHHSNFGSSQLEIVYSRKN